MNPAEPRPCRSGAFDNRSVFSRVRMMLVTFIALACVSCSLFPKKDLNGTEDEKPKAAQTILTSLGAVNATLDVLYSSVSRGLDESVLKSLELFIVEAAAKKSDSRERADLIKTGLEILVDLKSSKIDASAFKEAVLALRQAIILFDMPALRYIQDVGRLPVAQALALDSQLFSINNNLARGLFTLAAVVDRAGLEPKDGTLPVVEPEIVTQVKEIESKLIKIKTDSFVVLQPFLADALLSSEKRPASDSSDPKQKLFAVSILDNGVMLTSALQNQRDTGQIDKTSFSASLKAWSADLKTLAAESATQGKIPELPTIPESAPKLDSANGSLPSGIVNWEFSLVEKPTLGTVDLKQNPPVYSPTTSENFSIDRYSFRACFKMVPTFCSTTFAVIVQTPLKPWTVTLKTSDGIANEFVRGDELVCAAALESASQTAVFRWTLVGVRPIDGGNYQSKSMDVTSWQTSPGKLKIPNSKTGTSGDDRDVRKGDKIRCEVKARTPNGLESAYTAPTLAVMTANNSEPSEIKTLGAFIGFNEQIAGENVPTSSSATLEVSDMDGAWNEYDDTASANHILSVTLDDCDVVAPATCPFEIETPQTQPSSRTGTYSVTLKQTGALNFETKSFYDLRLKVVDRDVNGDDPSQQLVKVVRVPVIDRNDPVTALSPSTVSEVENKVFNQTLTAIDDDCPSTGTCQSTYNYALSGTDAAYFEIVGRDLRSKQILDFEQLELGVRRSPNYVVTVSPTDSAGVSYPAQTINITVTNDNESPSSVALSSLTIAENTLAGVDLGTLTTNDPDAIVLGSPDSIAGNYTYTLTMINTSTPYFTIAGDKVKTTSSKIDFELTPTLVFVVTAQDQGGKTKTQTFTVAVQDLNENPTDISFSSTSIVKVRNIQGRDPGNTTPTIDVNAFMDLRAIDQDTTVQTFTYEITETNGVSYDANNSIAHPFIIVGATLRPQRVLNYSSVIDRTTQLKLKVTDNGGLPSGEIALTVNLLEITLNSTTISENEGARTVGAFAVATGASVDESSSWTYSLVDPPAGDFFAVSGRNLLTTKSLDFETFPGLTSGFFYLKVRAVSTSGVDFTQQIKITIIDQNEAPTPIVFTPALPAVNPNDSTFYVRDAQAAGSELGTLSTTDPDSGDFMNWLISASPSFPDNAYFEFESPYPTNSKQIKLNVKQTLPAGRSEFTVRIQVTDQDGLAQNKTLVFKVVTFPSLTLESAAGTGGRYNRSLDEVYASPLQVDVKIHDATGSATCTKITGTNLGIRVDNLLNPGESVLSDSGISITEKQSAAGYKICTLSLVPDENAAGDVSFELVVNSATSVGTFSSQTPLSVPVTFWRKPELRCPKRISLPPGTSLVGTECKIHFSDGSAPASRVSELVSVAACGTANVSWSNGEFSAGTMPAEKCSAAVTVSGVTNTFGASLSFASHTLELVPRTFGVNGPVFSSTKDSAGNIYLGGAFTAVNPNPAPGMTSVSATSADRTAGCNLTEGFNGKVNAIVFDSTDESFLVGGDFTRYRNQEAKRLIRLTCSGEPASWFTNKGFDGAVHAIVKATDGTIVVGGSFSKYGTITSPALVRLKPNGVLKTSYTQIAQASSSDGVYALALAPATPDTPETPETLWVGGRFSSYASDSAHANLVRILMDSAANQLTQSAGVNLPVFALASLADGVVAGGDFTLPRVGVARLGMDGSLMSGFDSSSTFSDTSVRSLLVNGSHLFVGATGLVASLNLSDGNLNTGFGISGQISLSHSNVNDTPVANALALLGTDVVVGGRFTSVGASARRNMAKFASASGNLNVSFNTGIGPNDAVRAFALYNSNASILVGGEFSALGGTAAGRLASFNTAGNLNSALNARLGSGFNSDVLALQFLGNDLLVGGAFTQLNNVSQPYLVKLLDPASAPNPVVDGNFDVSTGGALNGSVNVLALSTDATPKLLVGGSFTTYRGAAVAPLIRIDASSGSRDTAFVSGFTGNPGRSVAINALAVQGSGSNYSVYVGGDFSKYKTASVSNLVKINQSATRDASFDVTSSGFDGPVRALLHSNSTLYVGGAFSSYKGVVSENIIALNSASAAIQNTVSLNGGEVRSLQLDSSGKLWAGGAFSSHKTSGVSPVVTTTGPLVRLTSGLALDTNGGLGVGTELGAHAANEFNSSGSGQIYNSTVFGVHTILQALEGTTPLSRLYVGGFFSLFGGYSSQSVVRTDENGAEASSP